MLYANLIIVEVLEQAIYKPNTTAQRSQLSPIPLLTITLVITTVHRSRYPSFYYSLTSNRSNALLRSGREASTRRYPSQKKHTGMSIKGISSASNTHQQNNFSR
jgi:hypothetical protein